MQKTTRAKSAAVRGNFFEDTRTTQAIILDVIGDAEAFWTGAASRFVELYKAGELPEKVIVELISKGAAAEVKRLRDHPAIYERARVINPDYDKMIAAHRKKVEEQYAHRAANPTAKEREAAERSKKLSEDMAKTWGEIEAALNFYHGFKLSDGTKLVHATKEKLLAEMGMEAGKSRKHGANAKFYKAICDKMPKNPKVTVGEVLKAEEISVIKRDVFD